MGSKWVSEEVWRHALDLKREQLAEMERPGYILLHGWKPDAIYTKKRIAAHRRSIDRVLKSGLLEWQERYNP